MLTATYTKYIVGQGLAPAAVRFAQLPRNQLTHAESGTLVAQKC